MTQYYDAERNDWVCGECGLCTDHCTCIDLDAELTIECPACYSADLDQHTQRCNNCSRYLY